MSSQRVRGFGLVFFGLLVIILSYGQRVGVQADDAPYTTVVGISLGNTYSRVAISEKRKTQILVNGQGHRAMPSYVTFTDNGPSFDNSAESHYPVHWKQTIFHTIELLGRTWSDPVAQAAARNLPYRILDEGNKPAIKIEVDGKEQTVSPEDVSSILIGELKNIAEHYLSQKVTHAVVSVPTNFTDSQTQVVKDVAMKAGLTVLRAVRESVVAAMAYGLDGYMDERYIVVCDLGGSTFDISLLSVEVGVYEVLGTTSIPIGGEDFNLRVLDDLIHGFNEEHKADLRSSPEAVERLLLAVERAKRILSTEESTLINIESLYDGVNFSKYLTRANFEQLNEDLFTTFRDPLKRILEEAKVPPAEVSDIVLVGGSSYIPKVVDLVEDFFGGKKIATADFPAEEAVSIGTGMQAGVLSAHDSDILESWWSYENVPLSLGIETTGGLMAPIIDRYTMMPARQTLNFSTAIDNQSTILIRVFEGERSMVKDNRFLGMFELTGIAPAPRGAPEIQVLMHSYFTDLEVTAMDMETGNSETLTIRNHTDSRTDIRETAEKMTKDYEIHREMDKFTRKTIEARIDLESYIAALMRWVEDTGESESKLSARDKKAVFDAAKWTENRLRQKADTATAADINKQKALLSRVAEVVPVDITYSKCGRIGGAVERQPRLHDEL